MLYAAMLGLPALALAQVAPELAPPQALPGAAQPQPPASPPPAPTPAPLLTIPRMLERPLGLEEGPRVRVTRFRLVGASNHPRLGVRVTALQARLQQALRKQPSKGYTINQLQQVAADLTTYYHSKGLILAQVIVPAQQIQGGVVELRVLEGTLEAVKVEGNKHYRPGALKAPFQPLVGKPFEQDRTDAALLRLTEYPGLSVFGVVTPGTAVGTSDLVLRVQRETPFDFDIGADNFGNKLSGDDRLTAGVYWNSPLGLGDRFYLYGLRTQTFGDSTEHTTYGGADYRIPFFAARSAIDISYSLNDYAVGESLGITGTVKDGEASYHQEFFRSRSGEFFGELNFADKRADLTFPPGLPRGQEYVTDVGATLGLRYSDDWRGFNDVGVAFVHGSLDAADPDYVLARPAADSSYNLVNYHLQRQQGLTRYQSLLFTVGGQWTDQALPTLEELALGGPGNLRGFDVAAYVADEGTYGSVEWLIGAPGFARHPAFGGKTWGDLLQFSLFFDGGRGSTNVGRGTTPAAAETMRDAGLALQFNLPNRAYARISAARRLAASPFFKELDSKDDYVYGSLGFHF